MSRRFVAATETALAELMAADLSELDLVAIMVDGVHFAEHLCVVALGIDIDGTKHPLALVEGDTENATVVKRPPGRAARAGARRDQAHPGRARRRQGAERRRCKAVFDHPVIARCQVHKVRNVESNLPKDVARVVVNAACAPPIATPTPWPPKATLEALARRIDRSHPGAAGSLREGLAETLHHRPPRRAADVGAHAALDQRRRVDDRDLP